MIGDKLNQYQHLEVLRGKTPEDLVNTIKSIHPEMQVLHFGSDSKGHFAYVRFKGKVNLKKIVSIKDKM
jgi:hypothetical protein